ncbi:MAG: hypothetical protein MJ006_05240 [Methanocorpusculum sp.]|nr:hypothetical protein [Methanocorpusculum sp.]
MNTVANTIARELAIVHVGDKVLWIGHPMSKEPSIPEDKYFENNIKPFSNPAESKDFVVYFPRQIPRNYHSLLSKIGKPFPLRSDNRAIRISNVEDGSHRAALTAGIIFVNGVPALTRLFRSDAAHANELKRTVMIRGPADADALEKWWHSKNELDGDISIKLRGETFFVKSTVRARDLRAPSIAFPQDWQVRASGACFACGKMGHTERNCKHHVNKCRKCGSEKHTTNACDVITLAVSTLRTYREDIVNLFACLLRKSKPDVLATPKTYRLISELARESHRLCANRPKGQTQLNFPPLGDPPSESSGSQ